VLLPVVFVVHFLLQVMTRPLFRFFTWLENMDSHVKNFDVVGFLSGKIHL